MSSQEDCEMASQDIKEEKLEDTTVTTQIRKDIDCGYKYFVDQVYVNYASMLPVCPECGAKNQLYPQQQQH